MERIRIFDTTLRDGEQSPGATMTLAEKLRMAGQLDALGVDILEAGFPSSSPDDFSAVRQISAAVRRPIVAALARSTEGDIARAAEALEPAERPRLHVFIATSEIHLRHKLRISRAECLDRAAAAVRRARELVDDVEFSAEDATRSDPEFLAKVLEAAIEAGATTVNVPDTVGYAFPAEYAALLAYLRGNVRGIENVVLSAHCHDDLGLAVANSLAAVEAGARQIECTVNGIGERAGNAALEEIVMALRVRGDVAPFDTAIHAPELYRTSQLLSYLTGIHPQPNKAIVGRNAFAHEAGIHQDGMMKHPSTYEIMTPDMVGAQSTQLVMGKHSGRNGLAHRYRELGYELGPDDLEQSYKLFKLLADKKKTIMDEDLISILHHGVMEDVPRTYRLDDLQVVCGNGLSEARVSVNENGGPPRKAVAQGDGPIAAALAAVDSLLDFPTELESLEIHSATPGEDAVGEVTVKVRAQGRLFTGRGASPDIVNGAVRAYLHALDKSVEAVKVEARVLERSSYLWGV